MGAVHILEKYLNSGMVGMQSIKQNLHFIHPLKKSTLMVTKTIITHNNIGIFIKRSNGDSDESVR